MNLLAGVNFSNINPKEDFTIRITRINAGWMSFDIGTPENRKSYTASYMTEALKDLVEAAIHLLKFDKDKTINNRRENFGLAGRGADIINHELEPGFITWHFQLENGNLKLLIWKEISGDLLECIAEYGYDNECYDDDYDFKPELMPDLAEQLWFALQMPIQVFAEILLDTLNDVERNYPSKKYLNRWFSAYPHELVDELRGLIK